MTVRILQGDARKILPTLEAESIDCVVVSPPYFGLRDYGTAIWEGGDPTCDHKKSTHHQKQGVTSQRAGRSNSEEQRNENFSRICGKCGAHRIDCQIGIEETPSEYVAALVSVFREVRRVLRHDGTVWLNIGDSYAGSWGNYGGKNRGAGKQRAIVAGSRAPNAAWDERTRFLPPAAKGYKELGIKPKDLMMIPARVALALQADGWWLRQDIIWAKPNPMPESVTDRCTKSHEYLFLLTKSERYYFDQDAIAEPVADATVSRLAQPNLENQRGSDRVPGKTNGPMKAVGTGGTRNKRSVWTIATQPFKEAHFATFPPALVEPCILAGCPEGGTVLDPFGGAGTVGLVADRLRRDAILIELNPTYAEMAERRLKGDAPLLAQVES